MYVRCVVRWFVFGGRPGHVDRELLARYLATRRTGRAVATVNMEIKALRAFYAHQQRWDAVDAQQLAKVPRMRKPPARLPRWFTDDQIGEIFAVCPDTFIGRRDRTILMTLYATGLRASELANMDISHLIDGDLLYVEGKGGHARYVPLGDTLAAELARYIRERGTTRPGKSGTLWVRENGRALRNGRSIWEIVSKRIWQAIGVRSGLHRIGRGGRPWTGHYPHELRSSCATALLHNGMPLPAVADLLGHVDMATTAHYTGADLAHLRAAAAHHPRAFRGTSGSDDMPAMKRLKVSRSKSLQDDTPAAPRRKR